MWGFFVCFCFVLFLERERERTPVAHMVWEEKGAGGWGLGARGLGCGT